MYLIAVDGSGSLLSDNEDCDDRGRSEYTLELFDENETGGSVDTLSEEESWSSFEILLPFLVEFVEPVERFCLERPLST